MLGNEVSDYKQQRALQEYARQNLPTWKKILLKSLLSCGTKPVAVKGRRAVALVANKKTARFIGVNSCQSSWCCPVCSSRQMSKYAAKIACALDALEERGQVAAMLTFTVPHTSGFTCEQATEILYNAWKAFTVHGNKKSTAKNDIFTNFMDEFSSKHRVRVCEYTWGSKGWHPHFHALFWFPKNRIQEIIDWEQRLNERWLELTKRYTIRQLLLSYPETQRKTAIEQVTTRVNIMYSRLDYENSSGVYISKDENNKVVVQKSSNYICGWGADREATGNYQHKATNPNHYSWQQILTNAINETANAAEGSRKKEGEDAATPDWWALFFEYAVATRKYRHARVNFSVHSGLAKIIAEHKNTEGYKSVLKKNATSQRETFGIWRTVCWFTVTQWSEICNKNLRPELIILATAENAKKLIDELLLRYQIPPSIENEEASAKLEAILNAA